MFLLQLKGGAPSCQLPTGMSTKYFHFRLHFSWKQQNLFDDLDQSCPWVQFVQPDPTQPNPPNDQPNPYQSENLDPGPNPTHNLTDPIKTTKNLWYKKDNYLTGAEKKLEMRRTTNSRNNLMRTFARFVYLRHYIGGFDELSA